ncbi:hypothetical protein Goshw_029192 [Gossypium schwendimanii]|uniref:Uncharacterized protein n=1 Tax=Gossypium schwendimanii TaxID=34291 RepID=A0A7J9M8J2_GOSSC|nr:hypothetical protein [Gossypium schwendimanii]
MEDELARLNIEDGEEEDASNIVLFQAKKNMMANLWHPLVGVEISNLSVKRFLFKFFNGMDMDRVV